MKLTIDDFPDVRDFCREHDITFTFVVEPVYNETFRNVMSDLDPRPVIRLKDNNLKFIFSKDINVIGLDEVRCYTEMCSENYLVRLWLPAWETGLIEKLKNKFNIYDSAIEAHDARRDAELWGIFNKPLDTPWFQHIEPFMFYNNKSLLKIEKENNEMKIKEMIAVPKKAKRYDYFHMIGIKKVIFNNPATIIIWSDNVKTVVKAENEPYDQEKGMAMAIAKRALGNEGNYYDIFKKWLPKEEKKDPEVVGKVKDVTMTDDGVVAAAEVTDDFSDVIREVSKYEKEEKMDSFF